MDRATLDRWCERGILGLTLSILVFGPLAAGAVGGLEFLVIQGLAVGVVILWIARLWIQENYRLLWPPICWCVVAFVVYAIVRYQIAEIEYVARGEFIKVLTYALLFFVVLNNLHRQEFTQNIVFVVVFLGMAVSLYAIYEFITNSPYVWHLLRPELKPEQFMKRGSGTYICPNNFAGLLEMLIPLGLAFTLKGRFQPTMRVFLAYASVAMLAGIGFSVSRGGWIATGIALVILFAFLVRYRDSRLPAIAFLVLLLGLGIVFFKQGYQAQKRWQQAFQQGGELFDVRFYLWKAAIEMWKQHAWFGVGPAHFDERFPQFRPELVQLRPGRVHNDYLNTLADWGVVGTVLVASAWVLMIWGILRTWRFVQRSGDLAAKPSSRAAFVLGAAMGLLAILIHSLTDFNMHIPANAILAVTLMAMLTGHQRFATERFWVSTGWFTRLAVTLVALLGTTYLAQQGTQRLEELLLLDRADRAQQHTQKRSRALEELWNKAQPAGATQPGQALDWAAVDRLSAEIQRGISDEIVFLKQAYAVEPGNAETTYRIGEVLRELSWRRGENYRKTAEEAMVWFARGMKLNPYNAYNYLRDGMCLDLLGRSAEAGIQFQRARGLDPRSYYVVALVGWHCFQLKDYAQARHWFTESLRLSDWRVNPAFVINPIAASYLQLIDKAIKEQSH